jgi:hypothetical protein
MFSIDVVSPLGETPTKITGSCSSGSEFANAAIASLMSVGL